jgi:hypothetical protein
MANPTTNYGFIMPTPTDLVTDLPADFGVFGQAVDTQMLTNANAAIAKTIVDAKGDLIGATAADTPARLAVGANGTVLTADSAEATGLKWATPATTSASAVSCYRSSSQSVSNATNTSINFNAEFVDTDAFHDNSTNSNRLTVPAGKAGKYFITATANFAGNSTGIRQLLLYKNATNVADCVVPVNNSAGSTNCHVAIILDLAVADYMEFQVWQNSGGSLNVQGNAPGTYTQFGMTYLGA